MMFANRFKQLRRELDYTQEELAQLYNKKYHTTFNKSTISQYENGKRVPDLEAISNWADLFNVSIDYLAGKTGVREINKGIEDEFITTAAHRADDSNSSPVKDIEGLKDLIRQIISEEKDR